MSAPALRRWVRRASPRNVALLAALVALPALGLGLALDDHWIRAFVQGTPRVRPVVRPWWDLFGFYFDPAATRFLMEQGVAPWWTDPEVRLRFFRPLSGALHALDARAFGEAAWPAHAVSVALYAALAVLATRALRAITPSPIAAALGALAFVVSAGHALPVGWLSNRNALVGALGATGALVLQVQAIRAASGAAPAGAGAPRAALAALSLAGGLCGAELGLGGLGLVLAAELGLARDALGRRALRLAPHAAMVVVWVAAYRGLGFGVRGSGVYLDPGAAPGAYLAHLPERLGALLGAALGGLPAELVPMTPLPGRPVAAALFAGVALAVLALALPLLRRRPSTRTFALATVLPLLPTAGTLPAGRLLMVASVGAAGLVGELLAHAWRSRGARGRRTAAVALGVLHGPLALVAFWGGLASVPYLQGRLVQASDSLDALGAGSARCLAIVHAPLLASAYVGVVRDTLGRPSPGHVITLASGERPVLVHAEGGALVLEAPEGLYRDGDIGLLVRRLDHRFADGAVVTHPCGDVTVEASAPEGAPTRFRFTPRGEVTLVTLDDATFRAFTPPAPGQRVHLAARPPL